MRMDLQQKKKEEEEDKTVRTIRRSREEVGNWNQTTALRFQTGV